MLSCIWRVGNRSASAVDTLLVIQAFSLHLKGSDANQAARAAEKNDLLACL